MSRATANVLGAGLCLAVVGLLLFARSEAPAPAPDRGAGADAAASASMSAPARDEAELSGA